jgi:RNA polymerase sigma-70 factor (ECF subfamily)
MLDSFSTQTLFDANLEGLVQTRASLLFRIRDLSSDESWKQFFETYWKLIYNTARRLGLDDAEAQDVVQETMIGVARKLPDFNYDPASGSFKRWLGKLILWRVKDRVAKRFQHEPLEKALDVLGEDNFDEAWESDWERNLIDAALDRVKRRISPKTYQIFAFCVIQKKGISETAKVFNVRSATVYLARHRVVRAVKAEIEELRNNKYYSI